MMRTQLARKIQKVKVDPDDLAAWQRGLRMNPHAAPVFADWLEEQGAAHPRTLEFLRSNPGGRISILRHPKTDHVVAVHTPDITHMDQLVAHHEGGGGRFFSPANRRAFRSRLGQVAYGPGGVFFTESTQGPGRPRGYTVRRYDPETRGIHTVGEREQHQDSRAALKAAIEAAFAPETPTQPGA